MDIKLLFFCYFFLVVLLIKLLVIINGKNIFKFVFCLLLFNVLCVVLLVYVLYIMLGFNDVL